MKRTPPPPTAAELSAYVDGELSGIRRREVARQLATDPQSAALVDAYRRQNELLRLGLKGLSLTASRGEGAGGEAHRAGRPSRRQVLGAAAAVAFAAGTGGWWLSHRQNLAHMANEIAEQATLAHLSHADDDMAPPSPDTAAARLNAVTGGKLAMPDLSGFGLQLAAIYEVGLGGRRGIVLRYASPEGAAPVSCYFVPVFARGETGLAVTEIAGIGAVSRIDEGIGYAVVSHRPADELLRIARAGFRYLS